MCCLILCVAPCSTSSAYAGCCQATLLFGTLVSRVPALTEPHVSQILHEVCTPCTGCETALIPVQDIRDVHSDARILVSMCTWTHLVLAMSCKSSHRASQVLTVTGASGGGVCDIVPLRKCAHAVLIELCQSRKLNPASELPQ